MSEERIPSFFEKVPPKVAFWVGVVTATALYSLAGFIIMLVIVFRGGVLQTTTSTNTNTNTSNTNAASAVALSSIDLSTLRNVRGTGDITLIEYSDTECPFCKQFHPELKKMLETYNGKIRWGYKHFPIANLHSKAPHEAGATECAAEQGKFWEYLDTLIERTPGNNGLADDQLYTIASDTGLDRTKFDDCLKSDKYRDRVNTDMTEAQKLGARGTPFAVLVDKNGKVLQPIGGYVSFDKLAATIDLYVKK